MADEYDLVPVSHDPFPTALPYGQFDQGDPYGDLTRYARATPLASGDILPVTRYADGSVRFDPHVGLLGPITGMPAAAHQAGMELSGDVPPSTDYPSGPSMDLIGKAANTAGLLTLGAGAVPAEPGSLRAGITMRGYHGSPNTDLRAISASPPVRQFDNGTSALGAFFAPDEAVAKRYAGDAGKVYQANLGLKNPYEMPVSEFIYLQDPTKDAAKIGLPGEKWGGRLEELKTEGAQLRQRLQDAGHDGVIVRDRRGNIKEISSFNDVPLGAAGED